MIIGSHTKSLTGVIKHDHHEMYSYHEHYINAQGDKDAQARWARQLIWEIARHSVAEEIVVYPLLETHLGQQGTKLANRDRAEHQEVKEILAKLEGMTPGTKEYDQMLNAMMKILRDHNESEEKEDLLLLEPLIGIEASKEAAGSFARTKQFVPTRPHSWAPNKPPYETLVAFMTMPIDKLKDLFSKFPTEEMKEAEQET